MREKAGFWLIAYIGLHLHLTSFFFFCQSSLDFSCSCSFLSEWPEKQSQDIFLGNFCWGGGRGGSLYFVLLTKLLEYCLLHLPCPAPPRSTRVDYTLEVGARTMSVRLLVDNLQTIETFSLHHFCSKVPHWQTCLLFTTWKIPRILLQFHKLCFAFQ